MCLWTLQKDLLARNTGINKASHPYEQSDCRIGVFKCSQTETLASVLSLKCLEYCWHYNKITQNEAKKVPTTLVLLKEVSLIFPHKTWYLNSATGEAQHSKQCSLFLRGTAFRLWGGV